MARRTRASAGAPPETRTGAVAAAPVGNDSLAGISGDSLAHLATVLNRLGGVCAWIL
nr:MAG TPA: hypothetical protein [Caudoviricetes sp.]